MMQTDKQQEKKKRLYFARPNAALRTFPPIARFSPLLSRPLSSSFGFCDHAATQSCGGHVPSNKPLLSNTSLLYPSPEANSLVFREILLGELIGSGEK